MATKTFERLTWVLIYAGLFIGGLGLWYMDHILAVGWTLLLGGGGMLLCGAVLVWVRSRRP